MAGREGNGERVSRDTPNGASTSHERALFDSLRKNEANLTHLLDVAVQVLRDRGLFPEYEDVLREDMEAAFNESDYDPADRWER